MEGFFSADQKWWDEHLGEVLQAIKRIQSGYCCAMTLFENGVRSYQPEEIRQKQIREDRDFQAFLETKGQEVLDHFAGQRAETIADVLRPQTN